MVMACPTPCCEMAAKYFTVCAPGTPASGPELTISPASSERCIAVRKICADPVEGNLTSRSCTSLCPVGSAHSRW